MTSKMPRYDYFFGRSFERRSSQGTLEEMGVEGIWVKYGLILAALMAFGACSSPELAKREGAPSRSLASYTAKYHLECISDATILSNSASIADPIGTVSPALAAGLVNADREGRTRIVALALAESFAYGQKLLDEYEALLDRGYSTEKIMRTSSVYAELHALYFIRHDLERLAGSQFVSGLVDRLEEEDSEGSRGGARGLELVNHQADSHLEKFRKIIARRTAEPNYSTLALAEVEDGLSELKNTASHCGGGFGVMQPGALRLPKDEREMRVLQAAKALPKNLLAYRDFQPKAGEAGVSIESIVKNEAEEIRKQWTSTRNPQSVPSGKVIYPDAGKAGNIFGTTFPKGVWALTFDDGPHGGSSGDPSFTTEVLANLKKHEIKATFFILSQQIERKDCPGVGMRIRGGRPGRVFPELAIAERDQGHAVESHSYYHSQVPKDNETEQRCEINEAISVFEDKLGKKPEFFRLPYGAGVSVPKVRARIAAAGLIHVHWSVDTLDWQDHDPDSIVRRTLKAMNNDGRGIILFHDVHRQSVLASEKIMAHLKDPTNGLQTLTIPQAVDLMNHVSAP